MTDNKKKSITHTALIAAGAVLVAGAVLGGAELLKSKNTNNMNGNKSQVAQTATMTDEVTFTATVTTVVTTTAVNVVEPVEIPVTTEAHDDVPEELTGEWLRKRCINATHYYDKLSADYTKEITSYGIVSTSKGTIKIDNTAMTGEYTDIGYSDDSTSPSGSCCKYYFLNNIYVRYNCSGYTDDHYCSVDSTDKHFQNKPDRVVFDNCEAISYTILYDRNNYTNETEWTITDERYENGRRTATVSFSYDILKEGIYIPYNIKADVDVETGLWTACELDGGEGVYGEDRQSATTLSFKMTNIRFDDEAEAPMTAAEVREYLDSSGYKEDKQSEFKVENIARNIEA